LPNILYKMIIAIDFDGTLVEDKWPDIGPMIPEQFDRAKTLRSEGHQLILWTCREDSVQRKHLTEAVAFCSLMGLHFDAINENLPEHPYLHLGNSRKVYADKYIDDKAFKSL